MPSYTFKCPKCSYSETDILSIKDFQNFVKFCPSCHISLQQIIKSIPNVVVGSSFNGNDVGKVLKEKNEFLKEKNKAYSDQHRSLMEKTQKKVDKLLKKEG